jgi:cellulose synthase (UDP-forming)
LKLDAPTSRPARGLARGVSGGSRGFRYMSGVRIYFGHACQPREFVQMAVPSLPAPDVPASMPRPFPLQSPTHVADVVAGAAVVGALLLVALAPTTQETQLMLAGVMLAALAVCFRFGRRSRTRRGQSRWRLAVIVICTFLSLRYIHWRATGSLPLQFGLPSLVCGMLLFFAEVYGFVNMLFGFFINSEPFYRRSLALPADPDALPEVDIYIPTYNEDASVIRPTVIAATQMRYPGERLKVWVLDDGGTDQKCGDADPAKAAAARARRAELQALAARYGAGYLTRERNLHAKAGNINSALKSTRGELLLVLDCDHIPAEDFLERTVGFFLADPKLFVLQTPHNFVTPDPVERNLETYHQSPAENELFYDVMQPGLDFWGSSFFCGSAAVLRRAVIDRLGGVSGRTITEDAETTLDALSLGYTSAYYNRPMVSGLQPETFSGFILQRVRWGQGMWQIFLLKNPWLQPGLTLIQRLLYTNFAFYWGFAFARVVMLLAPPAYLIADINLCDATTLDLLAYSGPALVASLASTQYFYGRVRWPFMSQLYEIVQSVYLLRGLAQVLRRPDAPAFKVTPKGEVLSQDFVSSLSWPFYVLLGLTALSVVAAGVRWPGEPQHHGAIAFVTFWALLDTLLLLGVLGITFERRQLRAEPRARHEEPVRLTAGDRSFDARTTDASSSGAGVALQGPAAGLAVGDRVEIEFGVGGPRLHSHVQSVRGPRGAPTGLGLRYELPDTRSERIAVAVAFGSSERLVENNRRRHEGRTVAGGLLALAGFALRHGFNHLFHLLPWRRAAVPSDPSAQTSR